jgi:cytochrome b
MIVLLLISLLATTVTGFAVYGADQGAGPLAGIGSANEKLWEEVHEFCANFTVVLVLLHIVGVIVEGRLHHENLAKAMWTGWKKPLDK